MSCYFLLSHLLVVAPCCCCALLCVVLTFAPCCCCALLRVVLTFAPCCPVVNALPSRVDAHHFQLPPGHPNCCFVVLLFAFTPCFFALLVGTLSSFSWASGGAWNNTNKPHPITCFFFWLVFCLFLFIIFVLS